MKPRGCKQAVLVASLAALLLGPLSTEGRTPRTLPPGLGAYNMHFSIKDPHFPYSVPFNVVLPTPLITGKPDMACTSIGNGMELTHRKISFFHNRMLKKNQ